MAKFNVGEAFLQVVASVENIHKTIAAEVAKIQDIEIDVTPNMEGFREKVAAGVAGIHNVEVDVTPNLTGFREKVAAATSGFGDISVPVDVDDAAARAELAAFEAEANRIDGRNLNVKVDVDGQGATFMLSAISAGALAIAPALAPAITLLGTMPALITAVAAPIGTLVAGFSGVGDAVKAMSAAQAAATGTAAEQAAANEKLATAMAGLAPAAQSFVQTLQGQMVPALQALKFEVQQGLFPGLEQALRNIQPLIPTIAQGLANTGQVLGQLASQAAALMASGPFRADFAQIMDSNNRALASWGQAGLSLLDVFRNLASAAGPLIERFASWAQSASATFAAFIEGKRATGELGLAFQQAGDFISQLSTVLGQVASGIANFASAIAPLGSGFLSVVGSIVQFIGQLSQLSPLLAQVATVALGLVPVLSRLPAILSGIGTAATGLSTAFTFLTTAGGLATTLQGVSLAAGEMTTKFTGSVAAGDAVANMGGRLSTVLTTVGAALPVLGAAVVAASVEWQAHKTAVDDAAQALLKGGQAAQQVTTQLQQMDQTSQSGLQAWNWIGKVREWIGLAAPAGQALQEVKNRADELKNAMDPLARAQQEATNAQNEYLTAVQQFGPASTQAVSAQQQFEQATEQVKTQQDLLKTALLGTTQALQAQAAALGDTLSAHISFLNKVQGVNDALTKNKATLDLSTQAGRDNTEAVNAMVQAALTWEQDAKKSGASTQELATLHQQLAATIQATASKFGTLPPEVQKVVDAFVAAKPNVNLTPNIDIAPATSQIGQLQAQIQSVPQNWFTKFAGDILGLSTAVGQASAGVNGVPTTHQTTFTGDGASLLAAAAGGQQSIQGVVPDWLTKFAGDATNLVQTAQQADTVAAGVANKAYTVKIAGDASGVQTAASQATGSLNSVTDKAVKLTGDASGLTTTITDANTQLTGIADKAVKITADNSNLTTAAQQSVDSLNTIVDKNIKITADDSQALQAIQQVQQALASLQDKTVTVTTNYVTTGTPPGQAAGGIVEQMAGGGSLSPMSGSNARIVPPNTWRVIGDRMRGDEAFIPINNSPRSMAILGTTANRMGFGLAPMHSGGFTSSRDGRAWDWLEELLRRSRHGHGRPAPPPQQLLQTVGQPNTSAFGVGSTVGLSGSALPITPSMLSTMHQVTPVIPTPPSTGNGGSTDGRGRPRAVHLTSNSPLINEVLRMIRSEIRKQGGDVQAVLGV